MLHGCHRLRDTQARHSWKAPGPMDRVRDNNAFFALIKGTLSNGLNRPRDGDASQRFAPFKGKCFNGCHRPRDSDAFQSAALLKGTWTNGSNRVRDSNASQRTAPCEGMVPDGCHRLMNIDAYQRLAPFKHTCFNGCHRLRDDDAFHIAPCKGMFSNGRHRLRDSDPSQRTAPCEGTVPNGCHRLRDDDALQRTTPCKGTGPNARHRLRDCHLDHLTAILEGPGGNFHQRGRYVHLDKALSMDFRFCCSFNFISGVNNSHFKFTIQQPYSLECLRITMYQWSIKQDFCFEESAFDWMFMLLFTEHRLQLRLQLINGVCWHDLNCEHSTFYGVHFQFPRRIRHCRHGCKKNFKEKWEIVLFLRLSIDSLLRPKKTSDESVRVCVPNFLCIIFVFQHHEEKTASWKEGCLFSFTKGLKFLPFSSQTGHEKTSIAPATFTNTSKVELTYIWLIFVVNG